MLTLLVQIWVVLTTLGLCLLTAVVGVQWTARRARRVRHHGQDGATETSPSVQQA